MSASIADELVLLALFRIVKWRFFTVLADRVRDRIQIDDVLAILICFQYLSHSGAVLCNVGSLCIAQKLMYFAVDATIGAILRSCVGTPITPTRRTLMPEFALAVGTDEHLKTTWNPRTIRNGANSAEVHLTNCNSLWKGIETEHSSRHRPLVAPFELVSTAAAMVGTYPNNYLTATVRDFLKFLIFGHTS